METKVVKFEIGKMLAVVIALAVIAFLAVSFLRSSFLQGNLKFVSGLTEKQAEQLVDCSLSLDRTKKLLELSLNEEEKGVVEGCIKVVQQRMQQDTLESLKDSDPYYDMQDIQGAKDLYEELNIENLKDKNLQVN